MTQKEKAMAYDEAIERARKLKENPKTIFFEEENIHVSDYIFPELKESEDEKIRKVLIHIVKDACNKYDMTYHYQGVEVGEEKLLAWLEKQGQVKESFISQHENKTCKENSNSLTGKDEQKPANKVEPKFHEGDIIKPKDGGHEPWQIIQVDMVDKKYRFKDGYVVHFSQEDAYEIVEQKPADNIEPKFKVGDWITNGEYTWKVTDIKSLDYILQSQDGNIVDDTISFVDYNYFRLWSINDAKPGDVLVDIYNNIGIFQKCEGRYWQSYLYLGCNGELLGFSDGGYHKQTNTHPATKEQRDALMKVMADASYTFDFYKKELKNIEQNPAWREEDEQMVDDIIEAIDIQYGSSDYNKMLNWLESLKDRVGCEANCTTMWKPSDEQIEALEHFVRSIGESGYASPYESNTKLLYSLLEQLKKL